MSMLKEFKEFAVTGNLVDMAIGVVMGTAFGKVVSAFIDKMVMPAIGMLTGGVDFSDLKWILKAGVNEVKNSDGSVQIAAVPEVAIQWGTFITVSIEFFVVAFVVFMVIKGMNKLKKQQAAAPAGPSSTDALLMEIRDALKK